MRSFDPRRVGELECDAWVAYYQRRWGAFLRAAVGLTRHTFDLSWLDTLRGAWWVLRANQLWAPYPDNDPEGARRLMERFYRMVARRHGEPTDPEEAARLEVGWWRVHRELQRGSSEREHEELAGALAALYSCVYSVPAAEVHLAGQERAQAMRHSDGWVAEGCDPDSPLVGEERAALIRSYQALLGAVQSGPVGSVR